MVVQMETVGKKKQAPLPPLQEECLTECQSLHAHNVGSLFPPSVISLSQTQYLQKWCWASHNSWWETTPLDLCLIWYSGKKKLKVKMVRVTQSKVIFLQVLLYFKLCFLSLWVVSCLFSTIHNRLCYTANVWRTEICRLQFFCRLLFKGASSIGRDFGGRAGVHQRGGRTIYHLRAKFTYFFWIFCNFFFVFWKRSSVSFFCKSQRQSLLWFRCEKVCKAEEYILFPL